MSIKVLLVDDHKIVRDGLRSLLEKHTGIDVTGEAENGRKAVQLCQELLPNVVVMDIGMSDLNGIEATRQILDNNPFIKVIALSMHSDKRFVSKMLSAGASGYLLKDCAFDELAVAIQTVISNKIYISPSIAGIVIEDYIRYLPAGKSITDSVLTNREKEVLQLLAEGISTKKIAGQLNVSVKTVETYRQQIMRKLDIYNIAELTKYAIREGMTGI
ncbi:MAG: DNA-binding response regulator [Sulfurimonas sp. RIFOXYD12_FULL_36_11]|nr:MAG: DNA-binding response regulator [Sulfurimonas sp. RIFOXYD12_FULL_36_11]